MDELWKPHGTRGSSGSLPIGRSVRDWVHDVQQKALQRVQKLRID